MLDYKIPEHWRPVTDKKVTDLVQCSGEEYSDEWPVYFDTDRERYLFLKPETFKGVEMMTAYLVARQPNDNQEEVDLSASDDPMARMGQGFCPPFNQRIYQVAPGVICMQDQEVVMRDGCKIYADIFRPGDLDEDGNVIEGAKVPAIVSWSWFGKRPGDGMSEWQIMGVPPMTVSKTAKFESPDPLYWCYQGYAVANVDVRGAGHSEGNVHMFTHQDREDGYDFVEWLGVQPWCNGNIGMSGNSGVAMHQWGIAAECPPHLKCIAPWEGTTDLYRESFYEGGVPALSFNKFIAAQVTGPNGVDDQVSMAQMYPEMNEYWEDKRADFKKIKIPVYQTAGWSHFHLPGSFNAWRRCRSHLKWLRAHRDFEWPDTYDPNNLEDLKRFYDRYLKGIHNGWEMTPRIRLDIMDAYDVDYQEKRAEQAWPIKRTEYKNLYLDATTPLDSVDESQDGGTKETFAAGFDKPEAEGVAKYDANKGELNFDYVLPEDIEVTGYMDLHLFVSCEGFDDMDLFINIQKAAADGTWIPWNTLDEPHPGAWGKCRVSRAEVDTKLTKKHNPVYTMKGEPKKLADGEVREVEIAIVPTARVYHKGERFRIQISGRYIREGWFEPLAWDQDNHGTHCVHTGGEHASYIELPIIPPRYQAGEYIHR